MTVESLTTRPVPAGAPTAPAGPSAPTSGTTTAWVAVCRLDDLVPERGAAALVAGEQVALFRLPGTGTAGGAGPADPGADEVLAVQQLDPFMDAHVMSRGIVGSRGTAPTVASPLLKQVFDLRTGRCLEPVGRAPRHLRTWRVRLENGVVLVATTPDPPLPEATGAGQDGTGSGQDGTGVGDRTPTAVPAGPAAGTGGAA
ncbi:MAG: nitrite reductase (NAD(P)H) small subunit [Actinotalea sp.]|nr:nitrite reductase (NAD(P)H) small subunit [Actinotalea sp.]